MKIALLADTHYGVRGDSLIFLENTKKFLDNIFFPYLKMNDIQCIVHLGDLVDRRKFINIQTAKRLREDFISKIIEESIDYHQIIGNHDIYYKNTTSVNAIQELCCHGMEAKNFHVYDKATEVNFDGLDFLMVPWICEENKEDTYLKIQKTKAQICLGHLEIQGFDMFKGTVCTHGEDSSLFSNKFDLTFSGHFHHKSSHSGITYLGSHAQFTWADYGDERGFHIFDTDKRDLTFIENPYIMFNKIYYDDQNTSMNELLEQDFSYLNGTICKVVVKNKNNPYWFDLFCDRIEKAGVHDMQIVENNNTLMEDQTYDISETQSTLDVFKQVVSQLPDNVNKSKIENIITSLFMKASVEQQ